MSNRYEIDLLDDDAPLEEGEGEAWMMSYLDVMTLLIAFFVLLLAMSEPKTEEMPRPETESGGLDDGNAQAGNTPTNAQQVENSTTASGDGLLDGSRSLLPASNSVVERFSPAQENPEEISANSSEQTMNGARSEAEHSGGLNQELADIASTLSTIAELGIDASPGTQELTLRIDDNLLFFIGNAELRYAGMMLLKELTPILADFSGQVSIEGHTDDLPISTAQFPSNWELSSARALAVLRFLDDDGLEPEQMRAVAYADSQPLAPNEDSASRATNRRVEIVLREAN